MVAGELCHFTRHCVGQTFQSGPIKFAYLIHSLYGAAQFHNHYCQHPAPFFFYASFAELRLSVIRDNRALKSHAFGVRHTKFNPCTRHTSHFSSREITNLGRYLTVLEVGIKWVSRTQGNQTSSFARTCPLFETLLKNVWRNLKIVRDFIKASYMFTLNLCCVSLGRSQTSQATPSPTQFCSLCISGSEQGAWPSRAFRLDGLTYAVTVEYFCFYHYCIVGTNINTFLPQGIDNVLSIQQKETLGHTLHTLPQHWPTECHRYISSIGLNAT